MSLPFVNNFPTSANDAISNSVPTNNGSSTLTGAITATTLLIPVADIAEFDDQGCATIVDDLENPTTIEVFDWTSKSGSNLVVPSTAERGQDGTSAASFDSGAYIEARPTRRHYSYTIDRLDAIETKLGTGSAIAVNKLTALTASRAVVSDGSGFLSASAITTTELAYLSGVTSAIQTQVDAKAATSSLAAIATSGSASDLASGTVPLARISSLTDAEISVSAAIDVAKLANGSVSNAEFQYLNGVTSAIQTQLDGKAASSHTHAASDIVSGTIALARLSGITTAELSATAGITNGQLAGSIAISKLSITGTPDGTKFLKDTGAWEAIPGGGDALTSNPLSQFASTTSLQLKGVISDETGSGALVFATSPTLVTPDLGTPSAATLTNATGLPIATGVSGLGSGVATFLATPSSANLAAAVTGETGTGALVFGTSPDFTAGATIGGVAIPTISSTHTLTNKTIVLADGSAGAPTLRFASDTSSLGWYRSAQGWTFSNVGTTTIALASEGIRLADVARISFANGNPASTSGDGAIVRAGVATLRISNDSTGAGNLILGTSAGAIGTSGAGVLAFTLSTAPSTAPTDTAQLYSADVSAGDHRLYLRNEGVAGSPVVTQISTDTLTNKTISGASNTLSNIGNSSLTNSSVTIGSTSVALGATAATVAGLTLTSPTIAKLANLTSNGLVTTSGGDGTLGVTVPGTGVLTALGVNVGSAGAFVAFNGALGTPSSGTATNLTGLPIASGVSGLGTGVATALGVNTGSAGAVVLFNGAGGTPASLTLTNATGLPPTTGISGWPANASGVLTNNGSGTLSWGAGGSGATTALDNLASVSINASLIPQSGKDLGAAATAWRDIYLYGSGTFGSHSIKLTSTPTGNRTITIPDATDTLAVLGTAQTFTAIKTFDNGVTTGSGATAGTVFTYNSLTTGNGADISSSSVTSGNVVSIAATGTAAASNTKTGLFVSASGANGTSAQTTHAARFSNTSTGTTSVNIGALFTASGGATNIPIAIVGANLGLSGFSGGTNGLVIRVGGSDVAAVFTASIRQLSGSSVDWSSSSSAISGGVDTGLARPQAATVRVQGSSGTVAGTFSSAANTPTQLTADTNNWAVGTGLFNRVSSDASRNVTGIVAGVDGQIAFDWNIGSNNIVYQNENASSTAANRLTCSTGADITLGAGQCLMRQYSTSTSRWLVAKLS